MPPSVKGLFTVFGFCFLFYPSWSQSDSTQIGKPTIVHISTQALGTIDSILLDVDFTVLSLVSTDLFDNWNEPELRVKFGKKAVLIVVARQDNEQKTKFVTSFYRNLLSTGSKQAAYDLAIKEIDGTVVIKYLLILNE